MAVQNDYGAGDLSWHIRIDAPTLKSTGDEIDPTAWTTFRECWACREDVQGRELDSSGHETSELYVDFVIRFLKPWPTTLMRVVCINENESYDIRAVKPTNDRKWIRLNCRIIDGQISS